MLTVSSPPPEPERRPTPPPPSLAARVAVALAAAGVIAALYLGDWRAVVAGIVAALAVATVFCPRRRP